MKTTILENSLTGFEHFALHEKVDLLNMIKGYLHEISPMKSEPVDCVLWVKNDTVIANDYNPNSVAPPEMELLRLSISADGYTQPIVSMLNEDLLSREVIDGFHRHRVGKECEEIQKRGKHKIDAMSDIVIDLKKRNWSDEKIAKNLGMDADEVLRLCQIGGLSELFSTSEFSEAWKAEIYDEPNEIDNENE